MVGYPRGCSSGLVNGGAVAHDAGVQTIYAEDFQHGREIEGVRFVDPFLPDSKDEKKGPTKKTKLLRKDNDGLSLERKYRLNFIPRIRSPHYDLLRCEMARC